MTLLGLLLGDPGTCLVTGVEENDDPPGSVRMYVHARGLGIYAIVADPRDVETLRRAWGSAQHLYTATPPDDRLYQDERPTPPVGSNSETRGGGEMP